MAVFMLANVNFYSVLSDFILLIHFAFVAFIVAGFLAIWVGYFRHWAWVHNFRFRLTHLLAMGFVLLESLFGIVCPLTVWEDQLRQRAGLHNDLRRLLYPDRPDVLADPSPLAEATVATRFDLKPGTRFVPKPQPVHKMATRF